MAAAVTADEIRGLERASIRAFVESCASYFGDMAAVLDYGSGLSPYQSVVEDAGGLYVPHDRADYPANVSGVDVGEEEPLLNNPWDVILCTQVLQYSPEPFDLLIDFFGALAHRGHLILTGPTNWPEVEADDLFRYTQAGVEKLLRWAGFEIVRLESRATVSVAPGFELSLGWGAVARA